MYLLFLDESGTPDDEVFALGGIAVRADEWHVLRERWDECLRDAGWPLDKELKWSGTVNGEVPPDVADAAYECLAKLPVECFVTVLYPKMSGYEEFFGSDENTYATALTFIAERFQRFLSNHDSYGVIVLDSRRRETDDRMRRFFTRIQRDGTPFAELERIVDGLLLGPSHFSLGLQLADLVVSCSRAATFNLGENSRRLKVIKRAFATNPSTGEVDGVGMKYFPDSTKPEKPPEVRLFNPREPD
ncbi:MAG: DUF3800 domain-containing protein [Solirubrobacterales bacterium]|nr:DUF3800 domain-containing protein [Solirubrobacterales bacterium]